jgi:hypothetical protein
VTVGLQSWSKLVMQWIRLADTWMHATNTMCTPIQLIKKTVLERTFKWIAYSPPPLWKRTQRGKKRRRKIMHCMNYNLKLSTNDLMISIQAVQSTVCNWLLATRNRHFWLPVQYNSLMSLFSFPKHLFTENVRTKLQVSSSNNTTPVSPL